MPGMPVLQAGRFAAPAGRCFPGLLGAPVDEANLVSCARAEGGGGARWVKVIADFPGKAAGTDAEANYPIGSIAQLVAALYQAGAQVAVHSTISDAGHPVAAGVDSIEHGIGLHASASANSSAATSSARSVSPKTRTRPPASGSSRRSSSRPSSPPRRLRPDARAGCPGQHAGATRRNRRSPGSWQASSWCPASITTAMAPVAYRRLDLQNVVRRNYAPYRTIRALAG